MPVTRIRVVDVPTIRAHGGWVRKSSEFVSALRDCRAKNIGPHEALEISMPTNRSSVSSCGNMAAQLNKFLQSEKLPYVATARRETRTVYIVCKADLE